MAHMTSTDLRLPVPVGWLQVAVPDSEVLRMMCPRQHDGEVTPIAAISRHVLEEPSGPPQELLRQVQARLRGDIHEVFEWPDIEDCEVIDLAGQDVSYLRFSHQASGHSLITELWSWIVEDEEWTVTGTVALEDYPTYGDVFEAIAGAFDPQEVWRHRDAC